MSDHYLKLTVIDGGRTKRRAEIGHVTYLLKELEIGDGSEQQLFKLDLEKVIGSTYINFFNVNSICLYRKLQKFDRIWVSFSFHWYIMKTCVV